MADERFEVQGRRVVRRDGVLVQDDVQLEVATDRGAAERAARAMAEQGFTSWVFQVHADSRIGPIYQLVRRVPPESSDRSAR